MTPLPIPDLAMLLTLEVAEEMLDERSDPVRQTIMLKSPHLAGTRSAYGELPLRALTWTEKARQTFAWELPEATIQIESRDRGHLFGWLNKQELFRSRPTWDLQWELSVGAERLLCQFGGSPTPLILPNSQWVLRAANRELLRGPQDFTPPQRWISEIHPDWCTLPPEQQLSLLACCLFRLLKGAYSTRLGSCP